MIFIADAHINNEGGKEFLEMLDLISKSSHDVVFLGDIFDMWVAFPRYEGETHTQFLAWCKEEKKNRTIGYIQGNHEFFLQESYPDYFSWCTNGSDYYDGNGNLFNHGDLVNTDDSAYRFLRKMTRNPFSRFLAKTCPFGPTIVDWLKRNLKKTNKKHRYFSDEKLKAFAEKKFAEGIKRIICGHFHREYSFKDPEGREVFVIPDWQNEGKIGIFDEFSGAMNIINWHDIN